MNNLKTLYSVNRKKTEELCTNLSPEDCLPQGAIFASPPKWHLAHTTWFFEEMILKINVEGYKVFDKNFGYLFNSYYNEIGKRIDRSQRGLISRPNLEKVYSYRKYVDENMSKLLSTSYSDEVEELAILGINHEQQHQELLLTDLKYTFFQNPILPKYGTTALLENYNQEEGWYNIQEGVYEIGHKGGGFSYDNELELHKVYLEKTKICKSMVTNGDYLEFILAGGYTNSSQWLDEGWSWVQAENITSPLYWYQIGDEWYHFTLAGAKKINPDHILSHISFYEASAFASFKGMRLPTEFEWEVAAGNLDWGLRWEWTNSAYLPYPRFKIKQGAVGEYNGKFMINQMVLRGGSVATAKGHSRLTYRNFFHPEMQWQFSGIRLAR